MEAGFFPRSPIQGSGMKLFVLLVATQFAPSEVPSLPGIDSWALVENKGQWATSARYVGRLPRMLVRIEQDALGLQLFERTDASRGVYVRLVFEGISEEVVIEAEQELPGSFNWFVGSDSSKWVRNAKSFTRVRYRARCRSRCG